MVRSPARYRAMVYPDICHTAAITTPPPESLIEAMFFRVVKEPDSRQDPTCKDSDEYSAYNQLAAESFLLALAPVAVGHEGKHYQDCKADVMKDVGPVEGEALLAA